MVVPVIIRPSRLTKRPSRILNPAIKTSGPSLVGMWVQPRFGFINQNATIGHFARRNLTAATKSCQTSNMNAL